MTNLNSKIEWTDCTWSPTVGCTKVTPGCDNCYAEKITERFHGKGSFAEVKLHHDRLDAPLHWRKPRRVFVNSMSDLFHAAVPDVFIAQVWAVMAATPRHTYQILTKRHGRMRSLLCDDAFHGEVAGIASGLAIKGVSPGTGFAGRSVLPNVWLGVSVEDQKRADLRIPALLETPAAVRFLSCEPLIGPVDLGRYFTAVAPRGDKSWCSTANRFMDRVSDCTCRSSHAGTYGSRLDWIIAGGESGSGSRFCNQEWVRSLVEQSKSSRVPVFVKQLGSVWARENGWGGKGGDPEQWPTDLRVRQFPPVEVTV